MAAAQPGEIQHQRKRQAERHRDDARRLRNRWIRLHYRVDGKTVCSRIEALGVRWKEIKFCKV